MAQTPMGQGLVTKTFIAAEAMATAFIAVKLDTTEGQVVKATDGSCAIGVIQEAVASGDQVVVAFYGITDVIANGAVAIGDFVNAADTTGYVDNVGDKEYALGIALTAATAQGDKIAILLTPGSNKTA